MLAVAGLLRCAPSASPPSSAIRRRLGGVEDPGATSAMTRLLLDRGGADPCAGDAFSTSPVTPSASLLRHEHKIINGYDLMQRASHCAL